MQIEDVQRQFDVCTASSDSLPPQQSPYSLKDEDEVKQSFFGVSEDTIDDFATDEVIILKSFFHLKYLIIYNTHNLFPQVFPTRDALVKWCRDIGKSIGVVVVTKHSDSAKSSRKPRVILSCERSGEYRMKVKKTDAVMLESKSFEKRRKETGSRKCGCPFKLKGSLDNKVLGE